MKTVSFVFFSFLFASSYCFGVESYEKNGNTVNCNGYDPQGKWHPCPSNNTKSLYERAKDEVKEVKNKLNVFDNAEEDLNKDED